MGDFGPPSKDGFARTLQQAIEKAGESDPLEYDPARFCLNAKGNSQNVLYLTNAYHEYCGAPEAQQEAVIRNFVRAWFTPRKDQPEDFEDAKPDLLPGVRSRALFEHTPLRFQIEGQTRMNWPYRPLAEFLGVGLIYDLPSSMMQVQQHTLDGWKTTFDTAFETACENLQEITKHTLLLVQPGVWESPWRDNYDPSRMLLLDFIRHHEVKGDPVAMVPNRDTLLLTGSQDSAGIAKLVEMAETAYEHPRRLSGMAFRLTEENDWVPFLPEADHPQYKNYRLLLVKCLGSDYADQKRLLDELHNKKEKDIFVASYSAHEKKGTREIQSYCVWAAGIVAFLPKTDSIFFFQATDEADGKIVATVPWEEAEAVLGDRMKPVGIYPERFLVEGFPEEDEIAAWGIR